MFANIGGKYRLYEKPCISKSNRKLCLFLYFSKQMILVHKLGTFNTDIIINKYSDRSREKCESSKTLSIHFF